MKEMFLWSLFKSAILALVLTLLSIKLNIWAVLIIVAFNLVVDWIHWEREQAYHNMLINLRRYIKNENANKREL